MSSSIPRLFLWFAVSVLVFVSSGCTTLTVLRSGQGAKKELTGSLQTEHLTLRFRVGGNAAAKAEQIGQLAERELARISATLEVKNDAHYTFFLFETPKDFHDVTKVPEPIAGFAYLSYLFIAFDDQQAMSHEMVHLIAHAKIGDSKKPFKTEGLGNALLLSSQGVQVHAWAKYYRMRNQIPSLPSMLAASDLTSISKNSGPADVYDIAASWMRFILETYGAEKLKRYYRDGDPKEIFGVSLATLEAAWLQRLDAYSLRPDVEDLLKTRHGVRPERGFVVNPGEPFSFVVQLPKSTPADITQALSSRFRWRKNGVEIEGNTLNSIQLIRATESDGGRYEITQLDDKGALLGTAIFQLRIIDRAITSQP